MNKGFDTRVLFNSIDLSAISIKTYEYLTPAEVVAWANGGRRKWLKLIKRSISHIFRYPLDLALFFRFLYLFSKVKCDVLLINNGGYPGGEVCRMASIAAGLVKKFKTVHIIHSVASKRKKIDFFIEWFIDRLVFKGVNVVVVSNAIALSLLNIRGMKGINLSIIPNAAPANKIYRPIPYEKSMQIHLLQVGYLSSNKNQKLTIEALGLLFKEERLDISVTFAGEEVELGYLHELEILADQLNVRSKISFLGFQNNIENLYTYYDAILLTSHVEGMPMCIIEAMSASRAVIATNVGGVSELVEDGKTGFLFNAGNPKDLSVILSKILSTPDILVDLGIAGHRRYVEHFTIEAQALKFREIIEEAKAAPLAFSG